LNRIASLVDRELLGNRRRFARTLREPVNDHRTVAIINDLIPLISEAAAQALVVRRRSRPANIRSTGTVW
jgi:hypothetical protein